MAVTPKANLTCRLPADQAETVREAAAERGQFVSQLVHELLAREFGFSPPRA